MRRSGDLGAGVSGHSDPVATEFCDRSGLLLLVLGVLDSCFVANGEWPVGIFDDPCCLGLLSSCDLT